MIYSIAGMILYRFKLNLHIVRAISYERRPYIYVTLHSGLNTNTLGWQLSIYIYFLDYLIILGRQFNRYHFYILI